MFSFLKILVQNRNIVHAYDSPGFNKILLYFCYYLCYVEIVAQMAVIKRIFCAYYT